MSDFWGTAKDLLRTVAPTIGTAIGGPLGGMAARAITGALLGTPTDDEAQAAEALRAATPEQLLALKKADQEFALALKQLDIRVEEIGQADRDSARRMAIETGARMPATIALAALGGFFGLLACMIFVTLPQTAEQPIAIMLGALGTLVTQIGAYYFGSTAGSAAKSKLIEQMAAGRRGG